jgi:hypothetical protein
VLLLKLQKNSVAVVGDAVVDPAAACAVVLRVSLLSQLMIMPLQGIK